MTRAVVLLVEDEILIADMAETGLSEAGFEVSTVTNGNKALAALEADAARFRAIVTDIRLGKGPDGWAIARRARELVPGLPIVYMTGDSAHEWSSKGVPNSVIIAKPFATAQIVTAVATLLNQADSSPTT